jgi:DUF971 family protein
MYTADTAYDCYPASVAKGAQPQQRSSALPQVFSDDHDTGIDSWDFFYTLRMNRDKMRQNYLQRLAAPRRGARKPRARAG